MPKRFNGFYCNLQQTKCWHSRTHVICMSHMSSHSSFDWNDSIHSKEPLQPIFRAFLILFNSCCNPTRWQTLMWLLLSGVSYVSCVDEIAIKIRLIAVIKKEKENGINERYNINSVEEKVLKKWRFKTLWQHTNFIYICNEKKHHHISTTIKRIEFCRVQLFLSSPIITLCNKGKSEYYGIEGIYALWTKIAFLFSAHHVFEILTF